MKAGDLVKMRKEPFPHKPYGYGILMTFDPYTKGYNCCVLFFDLINNHFNGMKWCNNFRLEVISECW